MGVDKKKSSWKDKSTDKVIASALYFSLLVIFVYILTDVISLDMRVLFTALTFGALALGIKHLTRKVLAADLEGISLARTYFDSAKNRHVKNPYRQKISWKNIKHIDFKTATLRSSKFNYDFTNLEITTKGNLKIKSLINDPQGLAGYLKKINKSKFLKK